MHVPDLCPEMNFKWHDNHCCIMYPEHEQYEDESTAPQVEELGALRGVAQNMNVSAISTMMDSDRSSGIHALLCVSKIIGLI